MEVSLGSRTGQHGLDEKAPRMSSLYTVTSHQYAQRVLTDNVRFSSAGYGMTMGQVMGRTILQMDPPEHLPHRALVASAFRTRVLDQWNDAVIGATVRELIDAFAGDGHADLVRQLTFPFPVRVIARILILLLPAGAETTYRSSSNLLFGLLSHPRQLDAVRADRGLVPQAIEEALRWETPLLTIARVAATDVELGGVRIPQGAFVAVSLGAANRDPARYGDPDAFDIFRDPAQHISFGDGAHRCLGMVTSGPACPVGAWAI